MQKIPTLYERIFDGHRKSGIRNIVTPGLEWVLAGEGIATEKLDGSCCAVLDGSFWRRYDAKKGKVPPPDAIPCGDPDPVTGHWPHWIPVSAEDPNAVWYLRAWENAGCPTETGTYEAIGPHFRSNPYGLAEDTLERHGLRVLENVPRDLEGLRSYLAEHEIEGIVFWKDGVPRCKIKRSDFGFPWGI